MPEILGPKCMECTLGRGVEVNNNAIFKTFPFQNQWVAESGGAEASPHQGCIPYKLHTKGMPGNIFGMLKIVIL